MKESFREKLKPAQEKRSTDLKKEVVRNPAKEPAVVVRMLATIGPRFVKPFLDGTQQTSTQEDRRETARARDRIRHFYNTLNPEQKKRLSHAEFEKNVLEAFLRGLSLFFRAETQRDEDSWQKPEKSRIVIDGGKRRVVVEKDTRRLEDMIRESYADRTDPILAYTLDKASIFRFEFLNMLKAALKNNIPPAQATSLAEHSYNYGAEIFKSTKTLPIEHQLSPKHVAQLCLQYPAQAALRIKRYTEIGPNIVETYWGNPTPGIQERGHVAWVSSPEMLRALIFRYPNTVERGLSLAMTEITETQKQYPHIPRDIIVSVFAQHADNYMEELKKLDNHVQALMSIYPADSDTLTGTRRNSKSLFQHLGLETTVYRLVLYTSERKAVERLRLAYERFSKLMKKQDLDISFRVQHRIMRAFLWDNTMTASAILIHEKRRHEQEQRVLGNRFERLIEQAERQYPLWGEEYALWGNGTSNEEIIESGKLMLELLREQYGDDFTILLLRKQFETLQRYLNTLHFEPHTFAQLREALILGRHNLREYFESVFKEAWPSMPDGKPLPEIPYDNTWEQVYYSHEDTR